MSITEEKIQLFREKLNVYTISSGAIDDDNSMLINLIEDSKEFVDSLEQVVKETKEDMIKKIFDKVNEAGNTQDTWILDYLKSLVESI